jgi:hypothetical protein
MSETSTPAPSGTAPSGLPPVAPSNQPAGASAPASGNPAPAPAPAAGAPRPATPASASSRPAATSRPASGDSRAAGAAKSGSRAGAPDAARLAAIEKLFPLPQLPPGASPELAQRLQQMRHWWVNHLVQEWPMVARKAAEYGGGDLELMAAGMQMLTPALPQEGKAPDQERAIAFYLLGKVARLLGAFERHIPVSRDTWQDAHVYAMMGLRVHDEGRWT